MLSFFDILIFTTTGLDEILRHKELWFAFVLWYSDIYNNFYKFVWCHVMVVICFRSLIFWYLQQLTNLERTHRKRCDLLSFFDILIFTTTFCFSGSRYFSCDLLSFFDILIFTTTTLLFAPLRPTLWFAFVLWYSDIYNNFIDSDNIVEPVVICFRSLIFWYLQQHWYDVP